MSEILQLIATYGVFPVILAAILVILLFSVRNQRAVTKAQQEIIKKQQEENSAQQKRLTEEFEQIMASAREINSNTNPVHTKQEERDNHRVNMMVTNQLTRLLNAVGANRVTCFLYHNGGRDAIGRSFQKMSMTHEVTDVNTVPIIGSYQNMPRMMFPTLIQKLTEQGICYIDDIEDIKTNAPTTYQALKLRGTKRAYFRAMRTSEHVELGFIAIEYSSGECADIDKMQDMLLKSVIKISGALEIGEDELVNNEGKLRKEGEHV